MAPSKSTSETTSSKAYPQNYFFYGSLMDPKRLSEVLVLDKQPELYPAKLTGFRLMLWGPYPALVPEVGGTVSGLMYEVQAEADAQRLQRYETSNYAPQSCSIKLQDGASKEGQTFVWAGDRANLEEGTFDLSAWQADNLRAEEEEEARIMALKARKQSIMNQKFASLRNAGAAAIYAPPPNFQNPLDIFPKLYFLYGSLASPTVLGNVLGLKKKPDCRQALVKGHGLMFWGHHQVLVQTGDTNTSGIAFKLQDLEEENKVRNYNLGKQEGRGSESNHFESNDYDVGDYRPAARIIQFEDGTTQKKAGHGYGMEIRVS